MGVWRTLHPRLILHAQAAISVHSSFRQASPEPGPSGQELRTLPTGQLQALEIHWQPSCQFFPLLLPDFFSFAV